MFSYFEYIFIFLPLMFVSYFYLNRRGHFTAAKVLLVTGSFIFYGLWKPVFVPLLFISIAVNYLLGTMIMRGTIGTPGIREKAAVAAGLVFNIGFLGYFKYTDFFLQNVNALFGTSIGLMKIMLPLGISFYTFLQISFIVDCYRGTIRKTDFLHYLLFISFFAKLLQGPITYHGEMYSQFTATDNREINYENISRGLLLLILGIIKKMVLADNLSVMAGAGFDHAARLNFFEAWFATLSFTFQVYFDFSGYTDIAIGIALMFNIRLPENFNSPFKATSIQDLWRRWHMTFMRFMRDFVYIPLGGSRMGEFRHYLNIMITFIVGGLWHGAGWGYVLWGGLNGAALIVHRIWGRTGIRMHRFLACFITFFFFNVSAVYFRASTMKDALKVHRGMFGFEGVMLPKSLKSLPFLNSLGVECGEWLAHLGHKQTPFIYLIAVSAFICFAMKNSTELSKRMKPSLGWALLAGTLFGVGIIHLTRVSEFIYANF